MKKILFLLLIFTWLLALKCFAQPIQEVDPRSIWKDGSKTTTASIPFAQGIDISSAKKITFAGATNAYIAANLPSGGDLTLAANDGSIANLNLAAANDIDIFAIGLMAMGGGGLTFTDNGGTSQFGVGNHTIPTTTTPAGIAFQSFDYIVFGDYGSGGGGIVFEDGVRIKPTVVNASRLAHTDSSGYLTGGTESIAGTYNFASTNNYTGQNTFGTLAPIFSTTTANTLLYGNGSKAITSATVSSPLSFSAGTLSCPTCALTTDYIRKDGTTTTTANIPFAEGATINTNKKLYLGTSPVTNSYITADTSVGGGEGIYINATDATLSRFYATATNDMRFTTTTGPIYMSSAGGFFLQETAIGNTINVDSTGINVSVISGMTADRLAYINSSNYLVSAATINGNYQWDGTQILDLTSTTALTVRRNASGGNLLVADTTNRNLILGDGAANDTTVTFDGTTTSDSTIKWDVADETIYVRTNGAPEYTYPTYGAGVVLTTYNTAGARYALQTWGIPTQANGTIGGYWGGFSDELGGYSLDEVYGGTFYNYFGSTTARTIPAIYGNYVGNEFSAVTQVTSTNIRGIYVTPGEGGGSIVSATNVIGIDINSAGFTCTGTCTNSYSLKLTNNTLATNNYGVFFGSSANATFRAGTQAIWSSAASTLDFTSNTTYNFKIGANPANGTAGTNYMTFTSARLAPVTTNTLDLGTSSLGWKTLYLDTSAVFNTTAPAQFRATTQSVYSSAASTLDLDTNTTGNLRVGGTVEYIWNASKFDFQANIADMTAGKAEMPAGTSLPASCVQGEYFQDTDSNDCANTGGGDGAVCVCKTTNTWALVANI